MYIGTHICLPVAAIVVADIARGLKGKDKLLPNKQLFLIAIAGFLPDLLWPHFSRTGRLNSWTHTIWFLALLLPIVILISRKIVKNKFLLFSVLFWLASVLHILTDALSGGVRLFYPFNGIIGSYSVPWPMWIKSDIFFVILLAVLLVNRRIVIRQHHSL